MSTTVTGSKRHLNINADEFAGDLNGTVNTATTATTQSTSDNSTKVATTAFVKAQGYGTSNLALGTTSTTALAGNTSLLQIGTTSTTAMAGNTSIPSISGLLPLGGGTMSGPIAMGNQNITGANNITAASLRCSNIVTNKVVKFDGTQLNDANITDTGSLITLGSNTVVSGELEATSLDINGNAAIDGNLSGTNNIIYGANATGTKSISGTTLDAAAMLKSGFYRVSNSGSTIPNSTSVNFLMHTSYDSVTNQAGFDLAANDSTTSQFYLRPATGGGKGAWQTIITDVGTQTISGAKTFSGQITTGYGVNFTNGSTNFLLYNNPNENVLYMRDTTNGAMVTTWGVNGFSVTGDLNVNGGDITLGGTGRIQGIDTVTDSTDAASKAYVDLQVSNLVDSAPGTLNTLNELADALGDDAAFSTTVSTALGNRVRVDTASQGLSTTEKSNARTNIGAQVAGTYSTATGVANNADVTPSWVPANDPSYLTSLSGAVLTTGNQSVSGTKSFTGTPVFHGATYWQVSSSDYAIQRADARDDGTNYSRLHWYGTKDDGTTSNFRHAWYDGGSYVNVTAASGTVTFGGAITSTGQITGTELEGTSLDINGAANISGDLTITGAILNNIENGSLDLYGGADATNDAHIKLYGNNSQWASIVMDHGYDATNSKFIVNQGGTERFKIQNNVAYFSGNADISGTLKINSVYTANTDANDLQIGSTNTGNGGLSIITGNTNTGGIFFGDNDNNDAGRIKYIHSSNSLLFDTNRTNALTIDSSQNATFAGSVHWDLSSGEYSGDPRALVTGYSGSQYGGIGYNIAFNSDGTHQRAFNDIPTWINFHNGIVLYASAAGSAGSTIAWTEILEAQTDAFQYKGQDIYHTGNLPTIPSGNQIVDWTEANAGTIHTSNYIENVDYELPKAAANTLGGIKVGGNLSISATGVLSAADTNTVYTHPTTAGNKHIPSGGGSGQFLKYSSSGTAVWATPSYISNTDTVDMGSGFIVANNGGTSQFTIVEDNALRFAGTGATTVAFNSTTKKVTIDSPAETYTAHESITQATSNLNNSGRTYIQDITLDSNGHVTGVATATETVTDTNTTYSTATSSALGLVKIGYSENGKNYPVELSSGKMYVNVPWSNTQTANTFRTIEVDSNGNGSADYTLGSTETLRFSKGSNISLDESNGVVEIAATNTTYSVGDGGLTQNNFTNADHTKLDGITTGATANSSDATLKARANHTGTQAASTISDFDTEVANNSAVTANTAKTSNIVQTSVTGSSGSCTGNAATATKIASITNTNIVQLATTTTQTGTKTFSGVIDITNTTASSNASGDTGALRCEGGASIAGKIYAGSTITGSADVIAFSDRKLKDNIETLDGKKVLDMRGVSFTRKDTGAESSGVIAQEIQKVAPELVHDTEGTLGVAYGNLVGYLIEAVKDQQKQIDELKEIINGYSK